MSVLPGRQRETGFTLIEVLIVMLLLSILMGALAGAAIVSLKAVAGSSTRLSTSHDRQLVDVYLPRDLSSARTAVSGTNVGVGTWNCAPRGAGSPTPVLVLGWLGMPTTTTTSPTPLGSAELTAQFEVDYVAVAQPASIGVLPDTASTYRLVRYYCTKPPGSGWSSATSATMVYGLQGQAGASVGCLASPPASPSAPGPACNITSSPPGQPFLTMTITDLTNATYSITGQMRTNS